MAERTGLLYRASARLPAWQVGLLLNEKQTNWTIAQLSSIFNFYCIKKKAWLFRIRLFLNKWRSGRDCHTENQRDPSVTGRLALKQKVNQLNYPQLSSIFNFYCIKKKPDSFESGFLKEVAERTGLLYRKSARLSAWQAGLLLNKKQTNWTTA